MVVCVISRGVGNCSFGVYYLGELVVDFGKNFGCLGEWMFGSYNARKGYSDGIVDGKTVAVSFGFGFCMSE